MVSAAAKYGVDCPPEYKDLFQDDTEPYLVPADALRLSIADNTLKSVVDALADRAHHLIDATGIVLPTQDEQQRIANDFRRVRPAENTKSLADILNAAWLLSEDHQLWSDLPQLEPRRDRILRELVLKNVEVFEIEQRRRA
jgi:hypothetical protein